MYVYLKFSEGENFFCRLYSGTISEYGVTEYRRVQHKNNLGKQERREILL